MSRFRIAVHIVPRRGILDPQGKAVADALHTLGFAGVQRRARRPPRRRRRGRRATRAPPSDRVREMCEKLLANPVTEDFEIEEAAAV